MSQFAMAPSKPGVPERIVGTNAMIHQRKTIEGTGGKGGFCSLVSTPECQRLQFNNCTQQIVLEILSLEIAAFCDQLRKIESLPIVFPSVVSAA